MTKRSKITLFGLLALIAAFGLVLTGCPDANTEEKIVHVYDGVYLTPGSHGYAANGKIIGLDATKQYVLKSGASWYVTKDGGTLSVSYPTPVAALADDDAAPLGVDTASNPITAITGLTNGNTYSVYWDNSTTPIAADATLAATVTDGKNTVVSIDGFATNKYVIIAADAKRLGSSLVVITDSDAGAAAIETGGAVTNDNRIRGKDTGMTYQFSAVAGGAKLQTVAEDATYLVLDDIDATFTAKITATTPAPTLVVKAAKSQGTGVSTTTITGLTAANKYVVLWRGAWYPVINDTGNSKAVLGTKAASPAAAVIGLDVMGNGGTLTLPVADEVYDVYVVSGELDDGETIKASTGTFDTGGLNAIANIAALEATEEVTTDTGFVTTGSRLIVLTGETLDEANEISSIAATTVFATSTASQYHVDNYGSFAAGTGSYVEEVKTGDTWFTITGGASGGSLVIQIKKASI